MGGVFIVLQQIWFGVVKEVGNGLNSWCWEQGGASWEGNGGSVVVLCGVHRMVSMG